MATKRLVTCIIGTGAVAGAWDPVLEALGTLGDFAGICSADAANLALARVVYVARMTHSNRFAQASSRAPDTFGAAKQQSIDGLRKVRSAIVEHLRSAETNDRLRVRPQFDAVVERFVKPDADEVRAFTTNWDGTVAKALARHDISVEYLHGDISNDATLYLPTEIADEPYRNGERKALTSSLIAFMDAVGQAHRLVLYGLSISALDAELAQGLAGNPDGPRPKEIVIVDLDASAVKARLATLIKPAQLRDIPMQLIAPNDLNSTTGALG